MEPLPQIHFSEKVTFVALTECETNDIISALLAHALAGPALTSEMLKTRRIVKLLAHLCSSRAEQH